MNELYCFNYLCITKYIYLYVRRRIFVLHYDNNPSQQIFKGLRKHESPVKEWLKKQDTILTILDCVRKYGKYGKKLIKVSGAKSKNLAHFKDAAVLAKYR